MSAVSLISPEGELIAVRVSVDPRHLEDALDAVAELSFPVNPEIRHANPATVVEFPAYAQRWDEVRRVLGSRGFTAETVK